MLHPDRVVRGDPLDVFPRRRPGLGELALVPAARHHDPGAGRGPRRPVTDHPEALRERGHGLPVELLVVGEALAERVHVRIDESRDDRAAVQVDDPRRMAHVLVDVIVAPDGNELPLPDRHRLRDQGLGVEGDDLAVHQNHLCGRRCGADAGPRAGRQHHRQTPGRDPRPCRDHPKPHHLDQLLAPRSATRVCRIASRWGVTRLPNLCTNLLASMTKGCSNW